MPSAGDIHISPLSHCLWSPHAVSFWHCAACLGHRFDHQRLHKVPLVASCRKIGSIVESCCHVKLHRKIVVRDLRFGISSCFNFKHSFGSFCCGFALWHFDLLCWSFCRCTVQC